MIWYCVLLVFYHIFFRDIAIIVLEIYILSFFLYHLKEYLLKFSHILNIVIWDVLHIVINLIDSFIFI